METCFEFYPELILQYPELNLKSFIESDGLESNLRSLKYYEDLSNSINFFKKIKIICLID